MAAICGATAGLARGGLLDDRRHTSNAREYLAATGYGGGALYQDEPAVTDGDLITAASMAPLEFAHHIFRRLDLTPPTCSRRGSACSRRASRSTSRSSSG